ncbi:hypothetical protein D3C81_2049120 [compost metagenome]
MVPNKQNTHDTVPWLTTVKRTVDGVKTQCTQSSTNSDVPHSKNVMLIAPARLRWSDAVQSQAMLPR